MAGLVCMLPSMMAWQLGVLSARVPGLQGTSAPVAALMAAATFWAAALPASESGCRMIDSGFPSLTKAVSCSRLW